MTIQHNIVMIIIFCRLIIIKIVVSIIEIYSCICVCFPLILPCLAHGTVRVEHKRQLQQHRRHKHTDASKVLLVGLLFRNEPGLGLKRYYQDPEARCFVGSFVTIRLIKIISKHCFCCAVTTFN